MLRDKVPEPLRALCVSVLDDDLASRDELKYAVNRIIANLSGSRSNSLGEESSRRKIRRQQVQTELVSLRRELHLARSDEYRPVTVAGDAKPASQVAREVSARAATDNWIPAPVESGGFPLPLSEEAVHELYASNCLPQDDEDELKHWLPEEEMILSPKRVAEIDGELRLLGESVSNRHPRSGRDSPIPEVTWNA